MKYLSSIVLSRVNWFLFWYKEYFKNTEGIKAFANHCMHMLMKSTLQLAAKLKKQNKELSEKIKELSAELAKRLQYPIIDADDYATIRKEIRNYSVIEFVIILAETFFNFFAAKAIFNFTGWMAIAAQSLFALVVTWVSIPLFRNFFMQVIHEDPYKGINKEPRSWKKIIFFLVPGAIIYEFGMYSLCKLRGEQIEGGQGGFITTLMIVIGMILPVIAGYFAYERRRYFSPYKNTLRVEQLQKCIATKENKLQSNNQRMEIHFKQECESNWAYLQEFIVYKENYNYKNSIPVENITGHYSETQKKFILEAIERYKREAIREPLIPGVPIIPKQEEYNNEIKQLFINA